MIRTHLEPLVLIGNDVLANGYGPWRFETLGIDRKTRIGQLVFSGRTDTYTV